MGGWKFGIAFVSVHIDHSTLTMQQKLCKSFWKSKDDRGSYGNRLQWHGRAMKPNNWEYSKTCSRIAIKLADP